ncbi:hypothetical protein PanWU01x14_095460 [Parasponia andersonii]|uniref:Uncharacterized protein n=1 Tax=Parasponia andersonii TaxID=3476 RepID=A0A2P5D513_PARAD|nr:hypothetical protein PanWU01x14_095460 [Parasponia andersonii]
MRLVASESPISCDFFKGQYQMRGQYLSVLQSLPGWQPGHNHRQESEIPTRLEAKSPPPPRIKVLAAQYSSLLPSKIKVPFRYWNPSPHQCLEPFQDK